MFKYLAIYIIFATLAILVRSADYLTEKPTFLTPCTIHENVDPQCFSKNLENLFRNWKEGVPGLAGIGSIDPFKIKRLRLTQAAEEVVDIQLELKNAIISGMTNTTVSKSSIDPKDHTISMQLIVPMSKVIANYKLKGRILLLNLDGRGQLKLNIKNLHFNVKAKTKLVEREGRHFFDIQTLTTEVAKIDDFKIQMTNLFNGNKELENSAHELFNNNWQILFNALRPGVTRTFNTLIKERYAKIYNFIPANYFVSDLP